MEKLLTVKIENFAGKTKVNIRPRPIIAPSFPVTLDFSPIMGIVVAAAVSRPSGSNPQLIN